MKILSFHLKAFGPFTNKSVDFSSGQEGLYMNYGPNEAGKTAALRALRALFFGIPERTTDNFLHDSAKLRIGGCIRHSDGTTLLFQRRKGRTKTLLSEDETPLNEEVLNKFLSNVGEELFSRMFGISHEDLVRGGRDLVAGRGDVGESLFAAGMGGLGLKEVLAGLDAEADDLFKPRASTKYINVKIGEYKGAKRLIDEASLSAREWKFHNDLLTEASKREEEVRNILLRLRGEYNRLERIQKALQIIGQRKELILKREKMGDVLILPATFTEERRQTMEELKKALVAKERATERLGEVEKKRNNLAIPEEILLQEEVITDLHQRLGSHLKAKIDLSRIEGERDQLIAEAQSVLRDLRPGLDLEKAESLRLTASQRQCIRGLAAKQQALLQKQGSSEKLLKKLDLKIQGKKEELEKLGKPRDVVDLRRAIRETQKQGDLEKNLGNVRVECETMEKKAQIDLKKLLLWSGTLEAVEALAFPPSETIDRFEEGFNEIEKSLKRLISLIQEYQHKVGELDRDIESLRLAGAVPTEADLLEARGRREKGWSLVRVAWLYGQQEPEEIKAFEPELPLDEAYEKSVSEADDVSDRLRREADRVAKKATWIANREQYKKDIDSFEAQKENVLADHSALQAKWMETWSPLGVEPLPPKEMRSWIQRQQALAQQAEKLRKCRDDLSRLDLQIEKHRELLFKNLILLGEEEPFKNLTLQVLLEKAQLIVDAVDEDEKKRAGTQKALDELRDQYDQAQNEVKEAKKELKDWESEWAEATRGLGLGDIVTPSAANAFLDRCEELFKKIDSVAGYQKRITGIQRDSKQFTSAVRNLADRVAPDLAVIPVEQAAAELNSRLKKAKADSATRDQLEQQYKEENVELGAAQKTIEEMKGRLEKLLQQAKCHHAEEMMQVEKRSVEAIGLDEKIGQLDTQLLAYAGGGTVEELITEAEKVDPDTLPVQLGDLDRKIQTYDNELKTLNQTIGSETSELNRMDGNARAAEAAESAQGIIEQIRGGVEKYIRLKLASTILRAEIERYRTKNQGPILTRASEIFSRITLERFSGLKTVYDNNDCPILVGLRSSGEEVSLEGMSDGTCDQLYLSLRLASLERHLEANEPMPFIIDDVLVNFDDNRAEATLKVLAELSVKTQVIFFTHHQHLLELAKRALDSNKLFINAI